MTELTNKKTKKIVWESSELSSFPAEEGTPKYKKIPTIGTQQMRQVQSLQSLQCLTILQNIVYNADIVDSVDF